MTSSDADAPPTDRPVPQDAASRLVSAAIITRDEERRLGDCLASLRGVVDEIVVLDSGSTDGTEAVARGEAGVAFHALPWAGFAAAKNAANALARHDWILSIDADERLTPELARLLVAWKSDPRGADASVWRVRRLNHFRGRPVRRCGWYPDWQKRLFDRRRTRWVGQVHEQLVDASSGSPSDGVGTLPGDLLHLGCEDARSLFEKVRRYSELSAEEKLAAGQRVGPLRPALSGAGAFVRTYVTRLGVLEGVDGAILSAVAAAYGYRRYARLRELCRMSRRSSE